MDCFHCLSLWVAAPFAYFLGESTGERLLLWPAISGGAILLLRATENRASDKSQQMPLYYEEEGVDDGMLRRSETKPLPFERQSSAAERTGSEN